MKFRKCTGMLALASTFVATTPAWAGDLQGYYIGGAFNVLDSSSFWGAAPTVNTTGDFDVNGASLSIFGGHNWVNGNLLYGIEAELAVSAADGATTSACALCETEIDGYLSLEGRLGRILNNGGLVYGTLGVVGMRTSASFASGAASATETLSGYTIGVGYEHQLPGDWSLRGDLTYMDIDNDTFFVLPSGFASLDDVTVLSIGVVRNF